MASLHEDSSKTMEEIRKDLICQICEGRPRPGKSQWYRCLNLHLICQDCKAECRKCDCDEPISKVFCTIFDKLLNVKDLKFDCTNTKHGCQQAFLESALEDHESECIYKTLQCSVIRARNGKVERHCKEEFLFKDALEHYKVHDPNLAKCSNKYRRVETMRDGEKPEEIDGFYFTITKGAIEIEYDGETFMYESFCFNGNVYFWVYFFGSPNEAKHFSVTMEFYGAKTTQIFKGQVVPIEEFFDDFVDAGKCFAIPKQVFMAQFVNEDRQFEYSLEIKNLKKELKDENCESGISDNDE